MPARQVNQPQRAATQLPSDAELLDWAEWQFPRFFPSHQPDQFSNPYTYRYYPASGNYVGVAGGDVYVMGPVVGGGLLRVGSIADFACGVAPQSCGTALNGLSIAYDGQAAQINTFTNTVAGAVVSGGVIGDPFSVLSSGTKLYLISEDPQGIVEASGLTFPSSQHWNLAVRVKTSDEWGLKTGVLRVQACLDPACEKHIQGSPIRVPYSVNIENRTITAAGTLGQPKTFSFDVPLPADRLGWSAKIAWSEDSSLNYQKISSTTSVDGRTGTITLEENPQYAGTYESTITVQVDKSTANGGPPYTFTDYKVIYTAMYDGLPCTVTPIDMNISVAANPVWDVVFYPTDFLACKKRMDRLQLKDVRYISQPQVPTGTGLSQRWIGQNAMYICSSEIYPHTASSCLPPGTYKGEMDWQVNFSDGTTQVFVVPLTATITP